MDKPKPANILLELHLRELGLGFAREVQFCEGRKWRFDYRLSALSGHYMVWQGIAIEIEGSVYAQGRHTRGKGFEEDCVKYNTATMMGYRVLRFSTGQILRGEAKAFLAEYLLDKPIRSDGR